MSEVLDLVEVSNPLFHQTTEKKSATSYDTDVLFTPRASLPSSPRHTTLSSTYTQIDRSRRISSQAERDAVAKESRMEKEKEMKTEKEKEREKEMKTETETKAEMESEKKEETEGKFGVPEKEFEVEKICSLCGNSTPNDRTDTYYFCVECKEIFCLDCKSRPLSRNLCTAGFRHAFCSLSLLEEYKKSITKQEMAKQEGEEDVEMHSEDEEDGISQESWGGSPLVDENYYNTVAILAQMNSGDVDKGKAFEKKKITKLEKLEMRRISLSGFALTRIPKFVLFEPLLQILDLHNNSLFSIPPEIGRLIRLESLNVSNNLLNTLPMELALLTNLKVCS
jgi:hypothetical protein